MRSNVLLLILVVAVAAVTALNSYTTHSTVSYVTDASAQQLREFVLLKMTGDAQAYANNAAVAARIAAEDSQRWQKNFAAVTHAVKYQAAYIKALEAKLTENKIELPQLPAVKPSVRPKAGPQPRTNST